MAMATLPALALRPDGEHFIVAKVSEDTVLIHDLALQRARVMPLDEFRRLYAGRLLQVTSRAPVLGHLAKFAFRWFVPAVVQYRTLLTEVVVVSFRSAMRRVGDTCRSRWLFRLAARHE